MSELKLAIAGVGNCASSLVQGIYFYKNVTEKDKTVPGLMHNSIGGYKLGDIKIVSAFDIDARKVGKDVSEAIFERPNNTLRFQKDVPKTGVVVQKGPVMDGVASHMEKYPKDEAFRVSKENAVDVAKALEESGADVLVNYMPVGSEDAARQYAEAALKAGVAFVNCMPVFIVSDDKWAKRFEKANLPCVGDDIKAQVGATITHRVLTKLWADRGVRMKNTYQLNTGGNTDFLNMIENDRLTSKRISKTDAVQSQLPTPLPKKNIHIGPSDYVAWQKDNKVCFIRMEGEKFGGAPVTLDLRLSVEDSPNSAGVAIDAIRCAKVGLDRGISGRLLSISAYTMKHPAQQFPDNVARQMVEEYIKGERER